MSLENNIVVRHADGRPLDEVVVDAVAEAKGLRPLELDVQLYETVDGDALNRIFRSSAGETTVEFPFADCNVSVRSDRRVAVTADVK